MSNDDPFVIPGTNAGPRVAASRSGFAIQNQKSLRASNGVIVDDDGTVIITPEKKKEEKDKDRENLSKIAEQIVDPLVSKGKKTANSMMMILIAFAAFIVIALAMKMAGGKKQDIIYCDDLPSWNQSANCI